MLKQRQINKVVYFPTVVDIPTLLRIMLSDMKRFMISLEPIYISVFWAVGVYCVPSTPQAGNNIFRQKTTALSLPIVRNSKKGAFATGVLPQANKSLWVQFHSFISGTHASEGCEVFLL